MGMKKKDLNTNSTSVPPVPSIPLTTVNPQPRNEASPVAPAKKTPIQAVEQKKPLPPGVYPYNDETLSHPISERAGDDKMLKGPGPKTRDRSIELQALLKSTIESPLLAQLTMGCSVGISLEVLTEIYGKVVNLYDGTK